MLTAVARGPPRLGPVWEAAAAQGQVRKDILHLHAVRPEPASRTRLRWPRRRFCDHTALPTTIRPPANHRGAPLGSPARASCGLSLIHHRAIAPITPGQVYYSLAAKSEPRRLSRTYATADKATVRRSSSPPPDVQQLRQRFVTSCRACSTRPHTCRAMCPAWRIYVSLMGACNPMPCPLHPL